MKIIFDNDALYLQREDVEFSSRYSLYLGLVHNELLNDMRQVSENDRNIGEEQRCAIWHHYKHDQRNMSIHNINRRSSSHNVFVHT